MKSLKNYIKAGFDKRKSKTASQTGQGRTSTPDAGQTGQGRTSTPDVGQRAGAEHDGGTLGLPNQPSLPAASASSSAPITHQGSDAPARPPGPVLHEAPNDARQELRNDTPEADPWLLEQRIRTPGEQVASGEQAAEREQPERGEQPTGVEQPAGGDTALLEVPLENVRDLWTAAFDELEHKEQAKLSDIKSDMSRQHQAGRANDELVQSIIENAKALKKRDKKQSWRPVSS